jgi:hypothetical protein
VSVLENRGLFFVRAREFDDPFEGSFPRFQGSVRIEELKAAGLPDDQIEHMTRNQSKFFEWQRHWMLINSWHMNSQESAAMWKLYAQTNEAVAIKSTFPLLRNCLPKGISIGVVKYINYETEWVPEGNIFYPYIHKRQSFTHERELRAILWETDWPVTDKGSPDFSYLPADSGKWVPVDLARLIQEFRVAPYCSEWFADLVAKVVRRYGMSVEVTRSSLEESPFF